MTSRRKVAARDTVLVREGICVRDFDDESVVLDLLGGSYFGLNELGAAIWERVSAGNSPAEIAEFLGARYEHSKAGILEDVLDFIDDLVERGLLEVKR